MLYFLSCRLWTIWRQKWNYSTCCPGNKVRK